MEEIWKDIPGFEGLYQVSNLGRIKSLERFVRNNGGCYKIKERILKPQKDKENYLMVNLWKENKGKTMKIHRLVAQAFIPNPESKPEIDHIDTHKTNNRADNLKWATRIENANNPISKNHHLNAIKGEKHPWYGKKGKECFNSKVIFQIKDDILIDKWYGMAEAERATGVNKSCISKCCIGKFKSAYGFRWIYASELDTFLIDKMNKTIEKRRTAI